MSCLDGYGRFPISFLCFSINSKFTSGLHKHVAIRFVSDWILNFLTNCIANNSRLHLWCHWPYITASKFYSFQSFAVWNSLHISNLLRKKLHLHNLGAKSIGSVIGDWQRHATWSSIVLYWYFVVGFPRTIIVNRVQQRDIALANCLVTFWKT